MLPRKTITSSFLESHVRIGSGIWRASAPNLLVKMKMNTYSKISEQRTYWDNFGCCVLCREVVPFSEAQNVINLKGKTNYLGL